MAKENFLGKIGSWLVATGKLKKDKKDWTDSNIVGALNDKCPHVKTATLVSKGKSGASPGIHITDPGGKERVVTPTKIRRAAVSA